MIRNFLSLDPWVIIFTSSKNAEQILVTTFACHRVFDSCYLFKQDFQANVDTKITTLPSMWRFSFLFEPRVQLPDGAAL